MIYSVLTCCSFALRTHEVLRGRLVPRPLPIITAIRLTQMFKTRLSNSHLYSLTLGCVQLSAARCVSKSDRPVSLSLPLLECNTSLPFQDHLAVTPFQGPISQRRPYSGETLQFGLYRLTTLYPTWYMLSQVLVRQI